MSYTTGVDLRNRHTRRRRIGGSVAKRIGIVFTQEQFEMVRKIAIEQHITRAEAIRYLVNKEVKARKVRE